MFNIPAPAPHSADIPATAITHRTASSNEFANRRLARRVRRILLQVIGMAVVIIPLVTMIPISGAVIAAGEVAADSRAKTIVHPTGGVLAELLVRDGQVVEKGQALLRFETNVTGPGARYSSESLTSLLARKARLEAEVVGATTFTPPAELTTSPQPDAVAAISREKSVFSIRINQLSTQLAMLEDQKRQIENEINGYRAQTSAIGQQRQLLEPELRGLRNLYGKELVTINRLNEAERTNVSLSGELATIQTRISQSRVRILELEKQKQNLRETFRSNAGNELNELILVLADGQVRKASANDAFERSVIRAPQAGVVDSLAFSTVGSAIPAGQEILRIVPRSEEMLIHAKVSPSEIDQVSIGQSTRVRFPGFNQQTTPEAIGRVVFVSPDRSEDQRTGIAFYRVKIAIDSGLFRKKTGLSITSGMPAEAFITTQSRSLVTYITKPLHDQIGRAFRDEQ